MKLQTGSLTPLYRQVMDDIKHEILTGGYKANERIPSEPALSEIYSVSRITIRRAVEELVGEGYLTKRQGKGTFVNSARVERKTLALTDAQSFIARCDESGLTAGSHLVELSAVRGSESDCRALGIAPGQEMAVKVHVPDAVTADPFVTVIVAIWPLTFAANVVGLVRLPYPF